MNMKNTSGLKYSNLRERILQNALHSGLKNPLCNGMKAFALLTAKLYKAQKGSETILQFNSKQWDIVMPFLEYDKNLNSYMFGHYICICNQYQ